jgi:peptidase E
MKILLTSAGFESKAVGDAFVQLLPKPAEQVRVLFIPTAALDDGAKFYANECLKELMDVGIPEQNITVYNFEYSLSSGDALSFDVIYIPGGDTMHLLTTLRKTGFDAVIDEMIRQEKVFVGVSAGSLVMTPCIDLDNLQNRAAKGLGYLEAFLGVHCNTVDQGWLDQMQAKLPLPLIALTDLQAVLVDAQGYRVIGN